MTIKEAQRLYNRLFPKGKRICVHYYPEHHQTAILNYKGTTRIMFLEPGSREVLELDFLQGVAGEQAFDPGERGF